MSEEELLRRAREGDAAAMEELLRRYYPSVLSYCLWHTDSRESAEDATQEVMLRLIRFLPRYLHRGRLRAYIYSIARSVCIDLARKRPPTAASLDAAESVAADGADIEERVASEAWLEAMVSRLPEELREVVLLRYREELTLKEVAEVTGVPLRTAQSRLHRAIKKIRSEMQKGAIE